MTEPFSNDERKGFEALLLDCFIGHIERSEVTEQDRDVWWHVYLDDHRAHGEDPGLAWRHTHNQIHKAATATSPDGTDYGIPHPDLEPQTPQPDPSPTHPAGTPHRPAVGHVFIDGRTLVDGAGPFLGGACSFFHGFRTFLKNPARFDEDAATMQAAGVDFARIISDLGWPGEKEWNGPAHLDVMMAAIDRLYDAFGIRTQLVLFGSLMGARLVNGQWEKVYPYRLDTQAKRLDYANAVCSALRGREHKVSHVEICNEPENPSVGPLSRDDQAELQRLVKIRLPQTLVCLGAPGGQGSTSWDGNDYAWYGQHGDLVLPHLDRGYRDQGYGHIHQGIHSAQDRYPWGNNEPIGPGASVASERNPTKLRMAATATWFCRGAYYCWHTFSGIGLDPASDYPLSREPGWQTVFAARAVLPADLPNFRFYNWHWDTDPPGINPLHQRERVWTDEGANPHRGAIRTLGMSHPDGRRAIYIVKVADQGGSWVARESMHLTRFDWTGNQYEPREERDYRAGEVFELAPAEDYIFLGRAL